MAGEVVFERVAAEVDQFDFSGTEETIAQADVDRIGQRSADAGECLIGEAAIRIVHGRGQVGEGRDFIARASDADTATDIAL